MDELLQTPDASLQDIVVVETLLEAHPLSPADHRAIQQSLLSGGFTTLRLLAEVSVDDLSAMGITFAVQRTIMRWKSGFLARTLWKDTQGGNVAATGDWTELMDALSQELSEYDTRLEALKRQYRLEELREEMGRRKSEMNNLQGKVDEQMRLEKEREKQRLKERAEDKEEERKRLREREKKERLREKEREQQGLPPVNTESKSRQKNEERRAEALKRITAQIEDLKAKHQQQAGQRNSTEKFSAEWPLPFRILELQIEAVGLREESNQDRVKASLEEMKAEVDAVRTSATKSGEVGVYVVNLTDSQQQIEFQIRLGHVGGRESTDFSRIRKAEGFGWRDFASTDYLFEMAAKGGPSGGGKGTLTLTLWMRLVTPPTYLDFKVEGYNAPPQNSTQAPQSQAQSAGRKAGR
uniref:Uncharacterized protein n=1 Tax=Chromera velia CCMP2878 TaxID=1169474 RepID=A0A0G4G1A4_9ALVE|eukprot:Cvel_19683.t1-p1 / transcript=Cvel_19683.t1 / gene=Cvel_19683 / organism=Chromera_velia_CCMP2878 / gene_product=hypothetical protein / transcript_product=hypothetical protein / location=Cvel_scaffold1716:33443-37206(+) / protein_length=409 / sequence_SO=supercontig / SO=protein_coding / is_pseudo=false